MSTTFSNALAGLNANALAIDTISGNLANLNTSGYKTNQVSFKDLLSGDVGGSASTSVAGSVVAKATTQFTQGSIQTTGQPYDAAIQGSGFFVLGTPTGQTTYTRAGNFIVDASGHLLSSGGEAVQGWNVAGGVLDTTGAPADIALPVSGSQQPVPTGNFSISANLNGNAAAGSPEATFSSPILVYDAQGAGHKLTINFNQTAPGAWSYNITIPSGEITGATGTDTSVATGTLRFDGQGKLATPAATDPPIQVQIAGFANGAANLTMNWNLYGDSGEGELTQFAEASANLASDQDGTAPGQLTGTSIGADGKISASYSNGASVVVAQLAMASVLNPDSMQNLGNNTYGVTAATATPIIGTSGSGSLGQIAGEALEASTVDIAAEFTNLLTYERGYQANSKVITTEDTITQTTVQLIQA
ncbi:MAG TPA: flagellar hook protein FlgE [Bryobacteraceae bacterium]|jgi:flagellar hook protein FlgE|nr:flagellar hook protein FlgE [Bryobacteraceae bacterium]